MMNSLRIASIVVLAALSAGLAYAQKAADPSLPRLAGILIWPQARLAIFTGADGKTTDVLQEGDTIGAYRVQTIAADRAVISGPGGQKTLTLEGAAPGTLPGPTVNQEPSATPALVESSTEEGKTIGLLATQRDGCARKGLLPQTLPSAETQLNAMLESMAHLHSESDADTTHEAPVKAVAAAMRTGWDAARAEDSALDYDAALCARVKDDWAAKGVRYGFH